MKYTKWDIINLDTRIKRLLGYKNLKLEDLMKNPKPQRGRK